MLRSSLTRPMSIALGAGTALSAFGVATPAGAVADCSAGVTVSATEAAIRAAISNGDTLICVSPGTIDMSSDGVDSSAEPLVVENADLTLIALGTVVFDGGGEAANAIYSLGSEGEDLSIDGFTFQDFYTVDEEDPAIVSLIGTTGQLTILNSTFTDNFGYSAVKGWGEGQSPSVIVDKSLFENNFVGNTQVWGKSDVSVTDSTFIGNFVGSQIVVDFWANNPDVVITGNFIADNSGENYVAYISTGTALITNNTFADNYNSDAEEPVVLSFEGNQDPVIAFNTFVHNTSGGDEYEDILIQYDTDATLLGNIWVSDTAGSLGVFDDTDTTENYIDAGGNFSTTDESAYLDDPSSSSNVAESALDLSEPADNGGPTWTAAIGADSVGIDAVRPSVASALLGFTFDVDQRGDDRVGNIDAGAFEFGELAATGVDASGIALTGGVLGAAGVALVARRRRKA